MLRITVPAAILCCLSLNAFGQTNVTTKRGAETQTFVTVSEHCVVGDQNLLRIDRNDSVIFPSSADTSNDSGIAIIKAASERSTKDRDGSASDLFYILDAANNRLQQQSLCITFLSGGTRADLSGSVLSNVKLSESVSSDIEKIAAHAANKGVKRVDFFYEAFAVPSFDGKSFYLQSAYLYVGKTLHGFKKGLNYLPAIELKRPGSKEVMATAIFPLLNNIYPFQSVNQDTLVNLDSRSQWIAYPAVSAANQSKLTAYRLTKATEKALFAEACVLNISPASLGPATTPSVAMLKNKLSAEVIGHYGTGCNKWLNPRLTEATGRDSAYHAASETVARSAASLANSDAALVKKSREVEYLGKSGTALALIDAKHANEDVRKQHQKNLNVKSLSIRKALFPSRFQQNIETQHRIEKCLVDSKTVNPATAIENECQGASGLELVEWSVTLTETKPKSKFIKKLGSVMETARSGGRTNTGGSTQAQESALSRMKLEEKLRKSMQKVDVTTIELLEAVNELANLDANQAVMNAKFESNELARHLGINAPYPEIE